MSAIEYYLKQGTPVTKSVAVSNGTGTKTLWTPESGKFVVLTDLSISANTGGTIEVYFDDSTTPVGQFSVGGSSTISPNIGCWQSTARSGRVLARFSSIPTNGWSVNLTGFEI